MAHQVFLPIGAEHGTGLLGGGQAGEVTALVEEFPQRHAPVHAVAAAGGGWSAPVSDVCAHMEI